MLLIAIIIICMIGLIISNIVGATSILTRCYGFSFVTGLLFLLVPGLNVIGVILMAIAGVMLILGRCKKVHYYTKSLNKSQVT